LKFGSEFWVLKKREKQRLEAAQTKFLRHLLGITKLKKEKNQLLGEKTGAESTIKEIKQYQEKWLQHVHPDPARKLSTNLYDIYHCCVYSEKLLMMDRGSVRNM
jgi:hypothetical protein